MNHYQKNISLLDAEINKINMERQIHIFCTEIKEYTANERNISPSDKKKRKRRLSSTQF